MLLMARSTTGLVDTTLLLAVSMASMWVGGFGGVGRLPSWRLT